MSTIRSTVPVLSVLFALGACAGTSERSESVARVDELLTRIERVQAETALAKDSAHTALTGLCTIVAPGFQGDAATEFAKFLAAMERSEEQGEALRDAASPMQDAADDMFRRWTKDLESFGNSRMRQRSQARLDETRTRFQSILGASQAAQIALDAFHADLQDHSLFLRNDLNATAVASIRSDVRALNEQVEGLDTRFDATIAAARAYVESAALYGQVEERADAPAAEATPVPESQAKTSAPSTTTKKRTVTTLKPKAATKPVEGATTTSTPTPAPTPEPTPTPAPEPTPTPDSGTPPQRNR